MLAKSKNTIILISILGVLVVVYFVFFFKKPASSDVPNLTSSNPGALPVNLGSSADQVNTIDENFLSELQNVRRIRLDDSIFSSPVFAILRDSTIILVPDGTEGRPNPFAPIGFEGNPAQPKTPPASGSGTTGTGVGSDANATPPNNLP